VSWHYQAPNLFSALSVQISDIILPYILQWAGSVLISVLCKCISSCAHLSKEFDWLTGWFEPISFDFTMVSIETINVRSNLIGQNKPINDSHSSSNWVQVLEACYCGCYLTFCHWRDAVRTGRYRCHTPSVPSRSIASHRPPHLSLLRYKQQKQNITISWKTFFNTK